MISKMPDKILDLDDDQLSVAQKELAYHIRIAIAAEKIRDSIGRIRRDCHPCEFEFKHRIQFESSEAFTDVWRHIPSGNHVMVTQPVTGPTFMMIPCNSVEGMHGTFDV